MRIATSRLALLSVALALAPAPAAAAGSGRPAGAYFLVGAGASQFTDDAAKDAFDTGVAWSARLGIGSRWFLGAELAYVGTMRDGNFPNDDLTEHGAEGVIRLQFPYTTGNVLLAPFALAGVGWSRITLDRLALGEDTDDVGTFPLGGGLTFGAGRFLVDGRFVYRTTFSEDTLGDDLEAWSVIGSIGYEF